MSDDSYTWQVKRIDRLAKKNLKKNAGLKKKDLCGYCEGNGTSNTLMGTPTECPRCVGTGKKHHGLCTACQAEGRIDFEGGGSEKCRACNGTGKA